MPNNGSNLATETNWGVYLIAKLGKCETEMEIRSAECPATILVAEVVKTSELLQI